jgi:hypothetical protein
MKLYSYRTNTFGRTYIYPPSYHRIEFNSVSEFQRELDEKNAPLEQKYFYIPTSCVKKIIGNLNFDYAKRWRKNEDEEE